MTFSVTLKTKIINWWQCQLFYYINAKLKVLLHRKYTTLADFGNHRLGRLVILLLKLSYLTIQIILREGYSRNASSELYLIFTFLLHVYVLSITIIYIDVDNTTSNIVTFSYTCLRLFEMSSDFEMALTKLTPLYNLYET